jgi:hypothetical protein
VDTDLLRPTPAASPVRRGIRTPATIALPLVAAFTANATVAAFLDGRLPLPVQQLAISVVTVLVAVVAVVSALSLVWLQTRRTSGC